MAERQVIELGVQIKPQMVEFNKALQEAYKRLKDTFADVDPSSTLGKKLAKVFAQIEGKFTTIGGLLEREIFTDADLGKVTTYFDSISRIFSEVKILTGSAKPVVLGVDTTEVEAAEARLKALRQQQKDIGKLTVEASLGGRSPEVLGKFTAQAEKTGFRSDATYIANYEAMEAALARATTQQEEYAQAVQRAEQAQAEASDAAKQAAATQLGMGNYMESVAAEFVQRRTDRQKEGKNLVAPIIEYAKEQLDNPETKDVFTEIIASWLEVDPETLRGKVQDILAQIETAAKAEGKGKGTPKSKLFTGAYGYASAVPEARQKTVEQLASYQQASQQILEATAGKEAAEADLATVRGQLQIGDQLIEEIRVQIDELKQLQAEQDALAEKQYRDRMAQARKEVQSATQRAVAPKYDVANEVSGQASGILTQARAAQDAVEQAKIAERQRAAAEAAAKAEQESFNNSLRSTAARWMSVQQIINIIKQGIRQAYHDIQGLDKAMTNIAVVTDMSISDLWGKIDEYMAIAQQYGVTTQGVYEVSQLYYQQGLATNEVMEATTETLKLARIAGMDYADAADAMTVAIRSFKMDMSDAARVTDVYSKVAAITASDSEELAIAMSKTASSAESVGSGFENTTAMLAVMIETTRESAQNLGSALKSIISRYGEMKVGMTVDSEGEEIDYNKVDTALKSVGISIKDAQGQFRDFDDVIFELSEKWDSLDKNTQRYIATIMAGNRQQSRFIALVDNWERLDEVAGAAHNAEDAGLLQYTKTLDSLETKLHNIGTSFQKFYMKIFNGPVIGALLDGLNNIIKAFSKMSTLGAIFSLTSIITGVKTGLSLILKLTGGFFGNVRKTYKEILNQMYADAISAAQRRGRDASSAETAAMKQTNITPGSAQPQTTNTTGTGKTVPPAISTGIGVAQLVGAGLNLVGTGVAATNGDYSRTIGTGVSALGNTLSAAATGAAIGTAIAPGIGTAIGAVVAGLGAAVVGIKDTLEAIDEIEQDRYERLSEELEEDKTEAAQASDRYKTLDSYLIQLKRLEETRYDSDENMQEWVDLNAKVLDAYPELFSTFDEQGNVIVDLIEAEDTLTQARTRASKAAIEAANTAVKTYKQAWKVSLSTLDKQAYMDRLTFQDADVSRQETVNGETFELIHPFPKVYTVASLKETLESGDLFTGKEYFLFTDGEYADQVYNLVKSNLNQTNDAKDWFEEFELLIGNDIAYIEFLIGALRDNPSYFKDEGTGLIESLAGLHSDGTASQEPTALLDFYEQAFLELPIRASMDKIDQTAWNLMNATIPETDTPLLNIQNDSEAAEFLLKLLKEDDLQKRVQLVIDFSKTNSYNGMSESAKEEFYKQLGVTPEQLATYADAAINEKTSYSAYEAVVRSSTSEFLGAYTLGYDSNDSQLALGNYYKIMQDKLVEEFIRSGVEWEDWVTDDKEGFSKIFSDFNYLFEAFYEELKGQGRVEEYNDFVKNANSYTQDEYLSQLLDFGLEESDAIYGLFKEQFEKESGKAKARFAKALDRFNFGFLKDKDSEEILGLIETDYQIPTGYQDEIVAYANYLQNLIDSDLLSQDDASELFNSYMGLWSEIAKLTDQEQRITARNLLAEADLTSVEGIAEFTNKLNEAGIKIEGMGTFAPLSASLANLNTAYISLQQKIAANIDKTASQLSEFEKGIDSFEELVKLADKFGLSIQDDFIFSDGKWFLKLEDEIIGKIEEVVQKDIDEELGLFEKAAGEQQTTIGEAQEGLGGETFTYKEGLENSTDALIEFKFRDEQGQIKDGYEAAAKIIQEQWAGYIKWYEEAEDKTKATFLDYLKAQAETELAALKAQGAALLDWEKEEATRASRIRVRTSEIKGQYDEDKITAYETLSSKTTGYTPEEIATLEAQLGKDLTKYIKQDSETGLYYLLKDSIEILPVEYQNQLVSLFENEKETALEAIKNLGVVAASGKSSGEYAEAFSEIENAETVVSSVIKEAVRGTQVGLIGLKTLIAKQLGLEIDDPIVAEAANAIIAGYKDGQTDIMLRFLELSRKQLLGTISEAEKIELSGLKISKELTSIVSGAATDFAGKYVALMRAAIKSPNLNWEQIEDYVVEGYTAQLTQLAHPDGEGKFLETYDAAEDIAEAEGQYSTDALAQLFAQATAETGKEISLDDFNDYFEFDSRTKSWILKSGADINKFFAQVYGEDVPEIITDAFSVSEYQGAINKAVDLDQLGSKVTDSVGTMMSDLTEVSLSDLITLYEDIHGEGSFAEAENQQLLNEYTQALNKAKEGTTEPLMQLLYGFISQAKAKGADVDTEKIEATVKDANNTLVSGFASSLKAGIDGTLTNVDFNNLLKGLGLEDQADIYRSYVTETYEGLELSAKGVLAITTAMVKKFGDGNLVARQLIEQFDGSGMLGSYKDIDNLIQQIEEGTNGWGKETKELLPILYEMRGIYSQLAKDAQFDFMNQDHFDGAADNWYTFTSNVSSAIETLESAFEEGGKIDYKSFDNIVTWLADFSPEGLDTTLGETNVTLKEFSDAVIATVDATGQLDLSAAAVNLGISMDDMAGALEGGIEEIAAQQIEYWQSYLNFLKGVKQLQEASEDITIKPPQIETGGTTYSYKDGNGLTALEAYRKYYKDLSDYFDEITVIGQDGESINIFSGDNNPLTQLMAFRSDLFQDGEIKAGMEGQVAKYLEGLTAWINGEFTSGDITKYMGPDGTIKIPWDEIITLELDPASGEAQDSGETGDAAGKEINDKAEEEAGAALEGAGFKKDGEGTYSYTLNNMTLKIQLGTDSVIKFDITNAKGVPPTMTELYEALKDAPGFSGDASNWSFTIPSLGFTLYSNGTIVFDPDKITPPSNKFTNDDLNGMMEGSDWAGSNGEYSSPLGGVTFSFTGKTGDVVLDKPEKIDDDAVGTYLAENGWTQDKNNTNVYTYEEGGLTFSYDTSTKELTLKPPEGSNPGVFEMLNYLRENGWSATYNLATGTYTCSNDKMTFQYDPTTGAVTVGPPKDFSEPWKETTSELNGWTYDKETGSFSKGGITCTYNAVTGAMTVTLPNITGGLDPNGGQIDDWVYTRNTDNTYTFTHKDGTQFNYNPKTQAMTPPLPQVGPTPKFTQIFKDSEWEYDPTKNAFLYLKSLFFTYKGTTEPLTIPLPGVVPGDLHKYLTDNGWDYDEKTKTYTQSGTGITITYDAETQDLVIDGPGDVKVPKAEIFEALLKDVLKATPVTGEGGKTTGYLVPYNGSLVYFGLTAEGLEVSLPSDGKVSGPKDIDAQIIAMLKGSEDWEGNSDNTKFTQLYDGGYKLQYTSESGFQILDPQGDPVDADFDGSKIFTQTSGWTEQNGVYSKQMNGFTLTYTAGSGFQVVYSNSPKEPRELDLVLSLIKQGWVYKNGAYVKEFDDEHELRYTSGSGFQITKPDGTPIENADISGILAAGDWEPFTDGTRTGYSKDLGNGITILYTAGSGFEVLYDGSTPNEPNNLYDGFVGSSTDGKSYTKDTEKTVTYTASGSLQVVTDPDNPGTKISVLDLLKQLYGENGVQENTPGVFTISGVGTVAFTAEGTCEFTPSKDAPSNAAEGFYSLLESTYGKGNVNKDDDGKITVTAGDGSTFSFVMVADSKIEFGENSPVTENENGNPSIELDANLNPITEKLDAMLSQPRTVNVTLMTTSAKDESVLYGNEAYQRLLATQGVSHGKNLKYGINDGSAESDVIALLQLLESEAASSNLLRADYDRFVELLMNIYGEVPSELSGRMLYLMGKGKDSEDPVTNLANSLAQPNLLENLTALVEFLTLVSNPDLSNFDPTSINTLLQTISNLKLTMDQASGLQTVIEVLRLIDKLTTFTLTVNNNPALTSIDAVKAALDALPDKTITVTVKTNETGGRDSTEENGGAQHTGNVSGLALANGNASDKLLAGASLAGKTLVGELGPELAVYDNQYHLLGGNGAEFVDLPKDAIVFNHRQTEGIIKGQAGYRGQALAEGNVSGPAAASGVDAAISAVEKIIQLWSNIADSSLSDLLDAGGGGGGGGGNSVKAYIAELQEWYNLSRQIVHIEDEINNIIAERENIYKRNGEAHLRSLREEQSLLFEEIAAQKTLNEYQKLQLKRQADQINQNSIWSQFLEIEENGLLQYTYGNEADGGKGVLTVLDALNKMSGEEQVAYLKTLNYTYQNQDGDWLEGQELVEQFFQELQDQIDSYHTLYDTVHTTKGTLEELKTNIESINEQIKENQMALEKDIYDILVKAWEEEIKALEEQKTLIQEANNAYVEGLNNALQTERDIYAEADEISERERLQRQLSLLRRSGGSASEIADLEEQLNETLQNEYFSKQEEMIQKIEDANEEQIKKLEEQILLEQEALEYQKINGVIWTKVYDVLSGSRDEILAFMQGKSVDFFSKSALEQEKMLTDWGYKVGLFTEDRIYQTNVETGTAIWESDAQWDNRYLKGLEGSYQSLSDDEKDTIKKAYASAYATSMTETGGDSDIAKDTAAKAVRKYLRRIYGEDEEDGGNIGVDGGTGGTGISQSKKLYYGGYTKALQFIGGENCYADGLAKAKELAKNKGIEVEKGNDWFRTGTSPIQPWKKLWRAVSSKHGELARYETEAEAKNAIRQHQIDLELKRNKRLPMTIEDTFWEDAAAKFYSTGGLVDYTGLAMVHGSKSRPESFLNASQTAQIKEALEATNGKENLLSGLQSTIAELRSLIHNISTIDNSINSSITVAPGAVVINVDQLADSYDVEALSADIMNRMVSIASKATNRGVNRR